MVFVNPALLLCLKMSEEYNFHTQFTMPFITYVSLGQLPFSGADSVM